jgi:hypothetical protein
MVLGSGSFGVVIEAWHISNGKRAIRRAIKVVHARHSVFEEKDLRRLNREVWRSAIWRDPCILMIFTQIKYLAWQQKYCLLDIVRVVFSLLD